VGVSDTDWVGRLSLRYNPNSDTSLFVSANRGYKGFGLNNSNSGPFFAPANNADPILNPETVISIEAGWKQIAFDGRLQTNLVAFWSEFTDFQTSAFDGASNTFSLRNAGSLEIKGIEFDAVARPWEGGSLIVGAAWIDSIFKEF
jgi:iron complex outermembrane receptor protein